MRGETNIGNSIFYQNIFIAILVLTIIPFLLLHFYNQPTGEDFYYSGEAQDIGLFNSLRVLYKFYGGRYTTFFLISIQPLYFHSLTGYNICGLLMMILFYYVLHYFISEFTKLALNKRERILLSLSIFFVYIISIPSSSQGFFWLISVLMYNVALMLMMLFTMYYYRIGISDNINKRNLNILLCCILAAAIPGTVELAAVMMLISISLLLLISIFVRKRVDWWLILVLLITIVCVYFVFTSPGNSQRSVRYPDRHQLWFSAYSSLSFMLSSYLHMLFNTPLVIVTFLLAPFYFKIINSVSINTKVFSVKIRYIILLFSFFFYIDTFVIMWSIGIFPYDRILNFIYFIFLIGWFWMIISLATLINRSFEIRNLKFPKAVYVIGILLISFFLIRENNITTAYSDLLSGNAAGYHEIMNERYNFIINNKSDSIVVDSIKNVPKSFFLLDLTKDNMKPFNQGYRKFFNKKYIVKGNASE